MTKSVPAITTEEARAIIDGALAKGAALNLQPLAITVLDAGGHMKAFLRQDGASNQRFEISRGKAAGAIGMGLGSRALNARAEAQAYFINAVSQLIPGGLVPVPGGVLIMADDVIAGAVGISGDNSDNDEACAIAGIEAAGLTADAG